MKKTPLFLLVLLLLGGCSRTENSAPEAASGREIDESPSNSSANTRSTTPATVLRDWKSADGMIALRYPASLTPTQDFSGTYFTPAGWRAMFDGTPLGEGEGLIRFTADSLREGDVHSSVADILQIGTSDDPTVVADCLNRGLQGGTGVKQQHRVIGGVRFTAYSHGDAGMSHQLSSLDLRAVRDGSCIAIDRITILVPASVDASISSKEPSSDVDHDLNAVLSSVTFR